MLKAVMIVAAVAIAAAGAVALVDGPNGMVRATMVGQAQATQSIAQVTEANFDAEVLQSGQPVVIDIYADWCGPCRRFAPTFDATSGDYIGKAKFARADADTTPKLNRALGISSIPSIVVVKKNAAGEFVYFKIVGAISKEKLKAFIDASLADTTGGTALPRLQ